MIQTKQEKAFELFASAVMILVMAIVIFPFLLLFISSITEENSLLINGYSIFPKELSFGAYEYIWNSRDVIFRAYAITICVTIVGTVAHVALVALCAYPLSLRNLPGRSFFSFVILFTMLFNGGIVPTYMIYTPCGKSIKNFRSRSSPAKKRYKNIEIAIFPIYIYFRIW